MKKNKTNEVAFTKEPWQLDDDEGAYRFYIYNGVTGKPICSVQPFDPRDREDYLKGESTAPKYTSKDRREADHNAALIVRSPIMYGLLKGAVDFLEDSNPLKERIKNCIKLIDEGDLFNE